MTNDNATEPLHPIVRGLGMRDDPELIAIDGLFGIDEATEEQEDSEVSWTITARGKTLCEVTAEIGSPTECPAEPLREPVPLPDGKGRLQISQFVEQHNPSEDLFAGVHRPTIVWRKANDWWLLVPASVVLSVGLFVIFYLRRRRRTLVST